MVFPRNSLSTMPNILLRAAHWANWALRRRRFHLLGSRHRRALPRACRGADHPPPRRYPSSEAPTSKVAERHGEILKSGSRKGRPLAARTVGHAHRVLHRTLERPVETEVLSRNVAAA